jgi:hypothetical protein
MFVCVAKFAKKKSPSKIPNQNQYIREMANSLHALPEKH